MPKQADPVTCAAGTATLMLQNFLWRCAVVLCMALFAYDVVVRWWKKRNKEPNAKAS